MQQFTQVADSLSAISHRGPDAKGLFETPCGTLGQVRLAILDVAGGHQPMTEHGAFIAFNGEIYNYRALRAMLPESTTTDSDTEVILKLFRARGPACVSLLDGMFAFAILDQDSLFLARDPLGIKPLYIASDQDHIWFASELKALIGKAGQVREFPAGHWWHSRLGMQRYFSLAELPAAQDPANAQWDDHALDLVRTTLREAVHKRLIADEQVPVGVSLSGGLDSSIVTALAREAKATLDTFVIGTADSGDVLASQEVADYLGTRHHAYVFNFQEMLQVLPEVIYHLESYDAPLVRSAIPNYFLAKLAAEHVKVILLGEGADELFAGYQYLAGIENAGQLDDELRLITAKLHNTNLQRADRMTMAHSIEGRVPFLDLRMVQTAFGLPAGWKMHHNGHAEKELLRRSVAGLLPERIVWRPKQKFSDGAGSMTLLAAHANEKISDAEYEQFRQAPGAPAVRSKEELFYYYVFRELFGDRLPSELVGLTRSITREELN
jgi:asparagine synthase (glutamine-hydrolysing)